MRSHYATNLPVFKGQKVRIKGSSKTYIAQQDIISNPVLIIGDKAIGKDGSRSQLKRTTDFFKSKTTPTGGEEYPWAYLFEINDFEELDPELNYTDTSWELDEAEGYLRQLGDGGGQFKTKEDLISWYGIFNARFNAQNNRYPYIFNRPGAVNLDLLQIIQRNTYNQVNSSAQDYGFGLSSVYQVNRTDGVRYPVSFNPDFGNNEFLKLIEDNYQLFVVDYVDMRVDLVNRQYYVRERINEPQWSFRWRTRVRRNDYREASFPIYLTLWEVESSGSSSGENQKVSSYSLLKYSRFEDLPTDSSSSRSADRSQVFQPVVSGILDENNSFSINVFSSITGIPGALTSNQIQSRLLQLKSTLDDSSYVPPSWSNPSSLTGESDVFQGDRILRETITINGRFPGGDRTIVFSDQELYFSINSFNANIYSASISIVPLEGRHPGTKNIYLQVRDNSKILLHKIPAYEPWDGYISVLDNTEIEVVLKCGKKHHHRVTRFADRDFKINQYPNTLIGNLTDDITYYSREWAQVRVYKLSSRGSLLSTDIYNNSNTDLNTTEQPDPIETSTDNWQSTWLGYQDIRIPQPDFSGLTNNKIFYRNLAGDIPNRDQILNSVNDTKSAFKTFYSEVPASYYFPIPNTGIFRTLIYTIGCGSIVKNKMIFVNPDDILDPEVDYEKNNFFRAFPGANYGILSGLTNRSDISKRCYILQGFSYQEGGSTNIIPGISKEFTLTPSIALPVPTNFPPLDLDLLPSSLPQSDWGKDFAEEDLAPRNIGIRAIAFLD